MLTMDESGWTCSSFEAQKWRKRKCKHCFQDIEQHSQEKSDENNGLSKSDNHGRRASLGDLCLSNADSQAEFEENLNREVTEITKNIDELEKWKHVDDAVLHQSNEAALHCMKLMQGLPHVSRKRSRTIDSVRSSQRSGNSISKEIFVSCKDDLQIPATSRYEEEHLPLQRNCSVDAGGILSRLSTVEFSSTSSIASFDPLEDNTLSSYSYSGSRDNLDGFASGDELCFPDGSNEARTAANDGKLVQGYEEKIENLEDELKSLEREKEREIQAFGREFQGLKLELANLSARENISIVKNRLEIEGKNQLIEELKDEIKHLQTSIDDLSLNKHSEESRQDFLQGEVSRRDRRILCLEEEKRSLEERLSLAEDLQKNDRDLLEVLRHQLTALESDLLASEDKNKQLEREIKDLKAVESELKEERGNAQKFRKHAEFLSGKLKLREQHVSYLEDDNVKMQQEKTDLEGKLEKSEIKIDSLSKMVKELQKDIHNYNQEVKQLCEENCQLEQAHWQVVVNQSDPSGHLESYLKDLEKRVSRGENRIREVECENESLISQSSEMLENLVSLQNEADESKRQLELMTESYNRLQLSKTDQDKRMITLQRKLKKLQKEKKRLQIEKQESEEKIAVLRLNDDKVSAKCDDIEKGYKMLQLKLQSTEAKLIMVERNKIYMESKLDEYEKKYKSIKDALLKVNSVADTYLRKIEGKCYRVAAQNSWSLESVEVKICKIIEHNDRSLSELELFHKGNQGFALVKNPVRDEIADLSNELENARKEVVNLKCQLEERERKLSEMETCFTANITSLTQHNDILEWKLDEMKEMTSAMEYYEGRLKPGDSTQCVDGDGLLACKRILCDRDSGRSSDAGSRTVDHDVYTAFGWTELRGKAPGFAEPCNYEVMKDVAELSQIVPEIAKDVDTCLRAEMLKEVLVTESFLSESRKCDRELNGVDREEEIVGKKNFEDGSCLLLVNEEGKIRDDPQNETALEDYAKELISETVVGFVDFESPTSLQREYLIQESQNLDGENGGITDKESKCVDEVADIASVESEMDQKRPFTSVKCVFKGETNGAGSILDYSALHVGKNHDGYTGELDWMQLGHGDRKSSESNTPHYTVAVSNLGSSHDQSHTSPVSSSRPKNDNDERTRPKLRKDTFMQISQDTTGAITLTIPKSSLDETTNEYGKEHDIITNEAEREQNGDEKLARAVRDGRETSNYENISQDDLFYLQSVKD